MAFSTEFVMGAGGGVEEIPVSWSGSGDGTVHPVATVDAGDGALIVVAGTMVPAGSTAAYRPYLHIGSTLHNAPHEVLTGPSHGISEPATGVVEIAVQTRRTSGTTTFDGTVYVARY